MSFNQNEKPQWAQQFNIDASTWTALCQQAEREKVTPLDLALDMGLLNENKLLKWDREGSKIANLKTVFFNGQAPFELWKDQSFQKCRAQACMPVAVWEGVTIWAKLSSDTTPLETENVGAVWVLAPWSGMKKWFQEWQARSTGEVTAGGEPSLSLSGEPPTGLIAIVPEMETKPQMTVTAEFVPNKFKLNIPTEENASEEVMLEGLPEKANIELDLSVPAAAMASVPEEAANPSSAPAGLGENQSNAAPDFAGIGLSDGHDETPAPEVKAPAPKDAAVAAAAISAPKLGKVGKNEEGEAIIELEFDTGMMAVSAEEVKPPVKMDTNETPKPKREEIRLVNNTVTTNVSRIVSGMSGLGSNSGTVTGSFGMDSDSGSGSVSQNTFGSVPQPQMAPPSEHLSVIIPEPVGKSKPTESAYNLDISVDDLAATPPPPIPRAPTQAVQMPPVPSMPPRPPMPPPIAAPQMAPQMAPPQMGAPPPPRPQPPRMSPPPPPVTQTGITMVPPSPVQPGAAMRGVRTTAPPPPLPSMSPIQAPTAPAPAPAAAAGSPLAVFPPNVDVVTLGLDQLEPRLKHAPNQDALAQIVMGVWQNYFEKIMILLFQDDNLLIWWHNNKWKSNTVKGEQIPVDTPSIFKIVVDTGHPYHGYVAPGEVNDLFFQKVNGGEYPQHVTVIPVVAGNRVVSMLLGTCSREIGAGLVLARLEENSHSFAAALVRVMSPAKRVA